MKTYITRYKLLFYISWIIFYLIYQAWALPVPVTWRFLIFSGLIVYFLLSAYLINLWFDSIPVDKPVIIQPENWTKHIKDNLWLCIVCCIAVILHIYPISSPIYLVGDEALFLQGGLWIYDFIGSDWHKFLQYLFWVLIGLTLLIRTQKVIGNFVLNNLNTLFSKYKSSNSARFILIFSIFSFLIIYFLSLRDLPYHISLIRYPPLQKFLYLISYFTLGISHIGPRIWQLLFYLLSGIYLYRTIGLFNGRESALLGASIYLFSPIIFDYAHFAEVASGLIFFIVLISFYFLRFIKDGENRDLLLTSYFIGTGFLYKDEILLMLFVCSAYFIFHMIKKRDLVLKKHLLTLWTALIFILPWLTIGRLFNWRTYTITWSHFTSFNTIASYFLIIPSQISWVIFLLFLLSIVFVLIARKNHLSIFYGMLFTAYYLFFTGDFTIRVDRFAMVFYPAIAVFLAQFISSSVHKIKWKHSFKFVFSVLSIYLIILCTIPPLSAKLITYKNVKAQYFPSQKAMEWVRDNLKEGERILTLRFKPDLFYRDRYGISREKIISFGYELDEVSTPQKLRSFCYANKVSHILFPYGPGFPGHEENKAILDYLKENRDNEFIEIAKFSIGANNIFIYKLRKDKGD